MDKFIDGNCYCIKPEVVDGKCTYCGGLRVLDIPNKSETKKKKKKEVEA